MKRIGKLLLILSLLSNMGLIYAIYQKNRSEQMVLPTLSSTLILTNLVELESSITYQMHQDWQQSTHCIEKLDDVKQGIAMTIQSGRHLGTLSQQDESLLWHFYYTLHKFPHDSGYPNTVIKNEDKIKFITLRDRLRGVGWAMNKSYSTDWNQTMNKIKELLVDLQTPSTPAL